MRKVRRSVLLAVIFVSLGLVAYKVNDIVQRVQKDFKKSPLKVLDYLPESSLKIKDFHRAKIENGRTVWELYGEEASYFKEQKEAVIKKPKFVYYDKKGEAAETTGSEAHLFLNEKELERLDLRGDVQVTFQGYVLNSEEANYLPAKDQIILPTRTTVMGEGLNVEGARMEVDLEEKKIRLVRDVKTKLEPDKLAKKKTKSGSGERIGG